MHVPTFLSTAALALTASAVLVPPNVADAEFFDATEPVMVGESHKSLELECRGCPVALGTENGRPKEWKEGAATNLLMDFAVEGKTLTLNGRPFYPPTPQNAANPLFVKQVYAEGEDGIGPLFHGEIPISMGMEVHPEVQLLSVKFNGEGVAPATLEPSRRISFEILGLADKVMRVDTLDLIISESDDNLVIFNVAVTPYEKHATAESDACKTVWCRVRASIRAKIHEISKQAAAKLSSLRKGCARKFTALCNKFRLPVPRPHEFHGWKNLPKLKGGLPKFTGSSTLAPGGKNHPHGPYGGHAHYGHHRHHFHGLRAVVRFFKHVITPIFIGVAAGMAVSGIGMIMGQLVVMIWLRLRGVRPGQYVVVETEERESFEELPKYEEAPEYQDEPPVYKAEKAEREE